MNELVKYQNDMNKLKLSDLSKVESDIFMVLLAIVREKGTKEVILSYSYIKKLANYQKNDSSEDFKILLMGIKKKLIGIFCEIRIGNKEGTVSLFNSFWSDDIEQTLTISINDEFVWLLNNLMNNYTIFELAEYVSTKSKYTKNLYRLLKQWRTFGQYIFHDLNEFRELMGIPTKYSNKHMIEKCVNVAVEEIQKLKSFENFVFEPKYASKRGKPLDKLIFTWTPERVPTPQKEEKQVPEQLQGQESFSDCQSFDEYMKHYQGDDKPTPVELKIARDIAKGNKKKQEEPQKNKFNNFNQRKYDVDELERLLLTTNVPH